MQSKRKDNTNAQLFAMKLAAAVLSAAVILLITVVFVKTAVKKDKKEIKSKPPEQLPEVSQAESIPDRSIDEDMLKNSFTYYAVAPEQLHKGLLSDESFDESGGGLLPIFNALFDKDGSQIASLEDNTLKCRSEMITPLNQMLTAFYSSTKLRTILISKAYQPKTVQQNDVYDHYDVYGNYLGYYADPITEDNEPCAEHDNGFSIDFCVYDGNDKTQQLTAEDKYSWFEKNCYKYGFILRYPEGKEQFTQREYCPAHFRYVGKAAARLMHEKGLCLEEFVELIKNYSYDKPLTVNTEEKMYMVYYIAAPESGDTLVQIPTYQDGEMLPFEISGNSADGFIITVSLDDSFTLKDNAYTELDSSSLS